MVSLAVAGGCAERSFVVAPVSGTVTLDGEPLTHGVVSFQPIATVGTEVGPGSTGRLGDQGRFDLATPDGLRGAIVAEHWVRIYSVGPESSVAADVDAADTPQERVPVRYNYRTTLRFTVPAAGTQRATFDL